MINILSFFLIFLGLFFILTAVIGCYRLPDYFSKMHAATVGDVVGCPLILIGIALRSETSFGKIMLLAFIFLIINPTASYILNRIALKKGLLPGFKDK
jgi:multicomponent Na+:H+ antiporter subunit G